MKMILNSPNIHVYPWKHRVSLKRDNKIRVIGLITSCACLIYLVAGKSRTISGSFGYLTAITLAIFPSFDEATAIFYILFTELPSSAKPNKWFVILMISELGSLTVPSTSVSVSLAALVLAASVRHFCHVAF